MLEDAAPVAAAPEGEAAAPVAVEETAATPVEEVAHPEDPQFARKFAALTRRERQIQEKSRAAAEREKAISEKWSKYEEFEKARERAKLDPLGYLEASGLTYQQVTDRILEDGNLSPEEKAERIAQAKIDEYAKGEEERRQKEREEREKSQQSAQEEALIAEYKGSIEKVITSDSDAYELIQFEGDSAKDLVFEVAAEHYDKTGEIIDPGVAAQHVENYLEKRFKEVFNTKKLSKLRDPAPEETQQGDESVQQSTAPGTLTNRGTLSASSPSETTSSRMLSDDESKARAAETLRKALASQG